jgi:hypothetical protein
VFSLGYYLLSAKIQKIYQNNLIKAKKIKDLRMFFNNDDLLNFDNDSFFFKRRNLKLLFGSIYHFDYYLDKLLEKKRKIKSQITYLCTKI